MAISQPDSSSELNKAKESYAKKLEGMTEAAAKSAKIAWNNSIDTIVASIFQQKSALVIKKTVATVVNNKNKLAAASLGAQKSQITNTVKNPTQAIVSGVKDPVTDSLKKMATTSDDSARRKSVFANALAERTDAQIKEVDDKIVALDNNASALQSIKFTDV